MEHKRKQAAGTCSFHEQYPAVSLCVKSCIKGKLFNSQVSASLPVTHTHRSQRLHLLMYFSSVCGFRLIVHVMWMLRFRQLY